MNLQASALEPMVIDTWNATLAGKPASAGLSACLNEAWLPALSLLLRHEGPRGREWLAAQQLLERLGKLLLVLPARREDPLARSAVWAFNRDIRWLAAILFMSDQGRLLALLPIENELLSTLRAATQVPGPGAVARAPMEPIMGPASAVAAPRGEPPQRADGK